MVLREAKELSSAKVLVCERHGTGTMGESSVGELLCVV